MLLDNEPDVQILRANQTENCPKTPQKVIISEPSNPSIKKSSKSRSQVKKRVKAQDESPLKISLKKQEAPPAKEEEALSAIKLRSNMFYVNSPLIGQRRESSHS